MHVVLKSTLSSLEGAPRALREASEAFILCGGRASRLAGYPKGLLPWKGKSLVEALMEQLSVVAHQVTLLGDPKGPYQRLQLPIRQEAHPGLGAPGALLGALELSRSPYVFVLSCDLVGLRWVSLARLQKALQLTIPLSQGDRPLFFGYRDAQGVQSLAGLWARRVLGELRGQLQRSKSSHGGKLPGVRSLIHACPHQLLSLPEEECWEHWNRPSDLPAKLRAQLPELIEAERKREDGREARSGYH